MDLTSVDYLAPVFAQYPIEVTGAHGVWLTTRDGRRILDLYGGHAVAALGYGHAGWTAALASQAAACNFQSNAVPMAVRSRAAARLVQFSQLPFASVFFVNSGAEANENALKLAFRSTVARRSWRSKAVFTAAPPLPARSPGARAKVVRFSAHAV
jgi:acetylornithine/succinyldiaminopimelate/putrescine aminotransferase